MKSWRWRKIWSCGPTQQRTTEKECKQRNGTTSPVHAHTLSAHTQNHLAIPPRTEAAGVHTAGRIGTGSRIRPPPVRIPEPEPVYWTRSDRRLDLGWRRSWRRGRWRSGKRRWSRRRTFRRGRSGRERTIWGWFGSCEGRRRLGIWICSMSVGGGEGGLIRRSPWRRKRRGEIFLIENWKVNNVGGEISVRIKEEGKGSF